MSEWKTNRSCRTYVNLNVSCHTGWREFFFIEVRCLSRPKRNSHHALHSPFLEWSRLEADTTTKNRQHIYGGLLWPSALRTRDSELRPIGHGGKRLNGAFGTST